MIFSKRSLSEARDVESGKRYDRLVIRNVIMVDGNALNILVNFF